nr:testis-expressed protein 30 isoform X5 [Pan paniscus]
MEWWLRCGKAASGAILGEAETGADFPAVRVLLRRRPPWHLPLTPLVRAYSPGMWRAGRPTLPACSAARPAHPGAWPARACVVAERCGGAGEAVASSALVSSLKGVTAVGCPRPLLPSRNYLKTSGEYKLAGVFLGELVGESGTENASSP